MIRDDVFLEIRDYLAIFRRRWPFLVIPTVIVLVYGLLTFSPPQSFYTAGVRYIVGQEPTVSAETNEEARQFSWIVSQYVVNSMTDWVNGTDFAARVSDGLAARGITVDMKTIHDNSEGLTIRSRLTLLIDHANEEELVAIFEEATKVLQEQSTAVLPQAGDDIVRVIPVDDIITNEIAPSITAWLNLPVRIVLALASGIGIALFIEYIDPKVHTRRHLRMIDVPVLGAIPKE